MHGIHAATSKVENSAQGSSCKLKFVHGVIEREREGSFVFKYIKVDWVLKKFLKTPARLKS